MFNKDVKVPVKVMRLSLLACYLFFQQNHQPRKQDNFDHFFKQVNGTMAASPPLIVGDSRYSTAEPKARQPSDPILPLTREKRKKGS